MTENERKAIDTLQDMITEGQSNGDVIVARDDEEELKTAIQALEELQQYRAIGTIDELQALKEKNELKKPDYEGDGYWGGHVVIDTWICPNCEKHYEVDYDDYDYCPNCGQHIDHSGLTEDD